MYRLLSTRSLHLLLVIALTVAAATVTALVS